MLVERLVGGDGDGEVDFDGEEDRVSWREEGGEESRGSVSRVGE